MFSAVSHTRWTLGACGWLSSSTHDQPARRRAWVLEPFMPSRAPTSTATRFVVPITPKMWARMMSSRPCELMRPPHHVVTLIGPQDARPEPHQDLYGIGRPMLVPGDWAGPLLDDADRMAVLERLGAALEDLEFVALTVDLE